MLNEHAVCLFLSFDERGGGVELSKLDIGNARGDVSGGGPGQEVWLYYSAYKRELEKNLVV